MTLQCKHNHQYTYIVEKCQIGLYSLGNTKRKAHQKPKVDLFVQIYFKFGGFTPYFNCLISDLYCFHTAVSIS